MGMQCQINDNIIPVIQLMNTKNMTHTEAFKEMSENLGITKQAVLDSCVRRVGLRFVKDFTKLVDRKSVV